MTTSTTRIPKALVRIDRSGWIKIHASPEWWRANAADAEWPVTLEELIGYAEQAIDPGLCGVLGRTTKRPCRYNTYSRGPCPNHCPEPLEFQCAAPTKGPAWCRSDLREGACPKHPDTHARYTEAMEVRRQKQEREQAEREAERARRAEQQRQEALAVTCPSCQAPEGVHCTNAAGEPNIRLHNTRYALVSHIRAAESTTCNRCGAQPGQLCRTASGNQASSAHAAR